MASVIDLHDDPFVRITASYLHELQAAADERMELRHTVAAYRIANDLAVEAVASLEKRVQRLTIDLRLAIEEVDMESDKLGLLERAKDIGLLAQ